MTRFGQAADFGDFQVDHIHRLIVVAAHHHLQIVNDFVQHEGPVGVPPNDQTLFVTQTRLFDVNIHITHAIGHAHRFVLRPAAVGVGHQHIARLQLSGDGMDARDVGGYVAARFELEFGHTLLIR